MPLPKPSPELVPFDEIAAVLADAAARGPNGLPALIAASSRHLAAALEAAGFRVVRVMAPGAQLTL